MSDLDLYETFKEMWWISSNGYTAVEMDEKTSRLENIVHQELLERLSDAPQIQRATLENYTIVRVGAWK